jgi:hypothetical protein
VRAAAPEGSRARVAPTLERASGAAMDAWMDWSAPVDVLSLNLYTIDVADALEKIDT